MNTFTKRAEDIKRWARQDPETPTWITLSLMNLVCDMARYIDELHTALIHYTECDKHE